MYRSQAEMADSASCNPRVVSFVCGAQYIHRAIFLKEQVRPAVIAVGKQHLPVELVAFGSCLRRRNVGLGRMIRKGGLHERVRTPQGLASCYAGLPKAHRTLVA
jgi:hypothetical protein